MKGFKSFAKKTEIPMSEGINVILGPNGSGKSNVTDALCFVLGRLSAKSMRAAKAKNLIFLGTKAAGPAKEASVEIIFDNSNKDFAVEDKELRLKRIVRKNGQSIYKINGRTHTRQDVLAVLAQAGIDPNGFNIILQGEIQNFTKMHTEERRKVIEEVAGISIYELRKERSLKELDKTEDKLKEVLAILRERTTYLNNLERERQEALRFKKLEKDVQRYKASMIYTDLSKKKKEIAEVKKKIEEKLKEGAKIKKEINTMRENIEKVNSKISTINATIQKTTGLEQEKLNSEIANLRADLAGLKVRLENSQRKISDMTKQEQELTETIRNNEVSIKDLEQESPTIAKKQKELNEKKAQLEKLEEQRKKFYMTKTELKSLRERIQEKSTALQSNMSESEFLIKESQEMAKDIFDMKSTQEKVVELSQTVSQKREILEELTKKERNLDKVSYTNEREIENQNQVIEKIAKLDVCPLCKNKITQVHMDNIGLEINPRIEKLKKEIEEADKEMSIIAKKRNIITEDLEKINEEIQKRKSDILKISAIENKKNQIKTLGEKVEVTKTELEDLIKRRKSLEANFDENSNIEQKYEVVRVEVQEISLRSEENVNSEISFKQRELERAKIQLKQLKRDGEDISEELASSTKIFKEKEIILEAKRNQEAILSKKCEGFIEERDALYRGVRDEELHLSKKNNEFHNSELAINNLKIDIARINAEIENLEHEMLEFKEVEIIKESKDILRQKLFKAQEILSRIGSVNLRSLEVYDAVKKEYDGIKDKVDVISSEKEGVLKIIHEIDIKKKKAFMTTLSALNEIFSRNFAQISTKGQVSLELDNKKDPFEGGVNIIVKIGHGKYFDVNSLSGGEQTMVALSLIFAIQELKPYAFYILDEIDAALDKRNSERLASLLKKYMAKGQYIVITHNDEVISNATNLFGISMHDGISKVISMKL